MKNRWFWLKQADDFTTILLDCKIVYNCDRSGQSSKCDDEPYANSTIYKMHLQFKADIALKNSRQTCRLTGRKKNAATMQLFYPPMLVILLPWSNEIWVLPSWKKNKNAVILSTSNQYSNSKSIGRNSLSFH